MIAEFALLKLGLMFFTPQQSTLTAFIETRTAGESSWGIRSMEAIELLHQRFGWAQPGFAWSFSSLAGDPICE